MRPVSYTHLAEVLASEKPILNRKCYLPKYEKYVEEFIIYYKDSDILISILKDITKEEQEAEKAQKMRLDTVEAVSYTHLDVYKRQSHSNKHPYRMRSPHARRFRRLRAAGIPRSTVLAHGY